MIFSAGHKVFLLTEMATVGVRTALAVMVTSLLVTVTGGSQLVVISTTTLLVAEVKAEVVKIGPVTPVCTVPLTFHTNVGLVPSKLTVEVKLTVSPAQMFAFDVLILTEEF